MFSRFGDDDEQGSGRTFVTVDQYNANVADANEWSNAFARSGDSTVLSSPPMVAGDTGSGTSFFDTWFGRGKQVTSGLVDIFGRVINPATGQPAAPVAADSGMPLVAWVALGVAGVVVLGVAARSLRRSSVAGYRRRSRRSRR